MKRNTLAALIAATLALSAGTALAGDDSSDGVLRYDNTFKSMDANSDGKVSRTEFDAYYKTSKIYVTWDVDHDGTIDNNEFSDGLYNYYNDDDNEYIDDAEWENGIMVDDYGDEGFWDV